MYTLIMTILAFLSLITAFYHAFQVHMRESEIRLLKKRIEKLESTLKFKQSVIKDIELDKKNLRDQLVEKK